MGLQHAFAMVGGLITPPLVVMKFSVSFMDVALQQYAVSAALITSGICTIINIAKLPIPGSSAIFGRTMYIGSGVLSVMGTSFTFLPVFEIAIQQMKREGIDAEVAYGKMLGTSMFCCLLELFLSFLPAKTLRGLFPPIVSSITVMLIGVALTGTGMKYWGGGAVCADMVWQNHAKVEDLALGNPSKLCFIGETAEPFGTTEYIGLGFTVLTALVVIELFGSVFMKNCNVILALLIGYLVSIFTRFNDDGVLEQYVTMSKIESAKTFTFLWVETFPIGFYAPAVIPLLIAYLVTTVETVGDISAVYDVSELDTQSEEYSESIQGGLTADAVSSILSSLFTSMPNTTFSQNNGVIALTKCASRRAGYACGIWLIIMGVFGKISGIISSIPDCVLGGMTIFLFSNVLVSGISLAATSLDVHSRRTKFILGMSLAIGVGVTVWPFAFLDQRASSCTAKFWPCGDDISNTAKGIRDGVSIFLSTGYCVGTVIAMFLNLILPADVPISKDDDDDDVKEEKAFEDDV
jgi:NCS2 family nucleobase:cation symporter-2